MQSLSSESFNVKLVSDPNAIEDQLSRFAGFTQSEMELQMACERLDQSPTSKDGELPPNRLLSALVRR
jgi:hypothetical protein